MSKFFFTSQHLWLHHCVFSSQNAFWLCLGVIAMFSLITIILCVRLAKHLRRAKTGEDIYSEEGTSNYGVPLRMFDKFPKLNKKKFSWYVSFITYLVGWTLILDIVIVRSEKFCETIWWFSENVVSINSSDKHVELAVVYHCCLCLIFLSNYNGPMQEQKCLRCG